MNFVFGKAFTPWILGALSLVLAIITLAESSQINPKTPFHLYQSPWFMALLFVFCVNIVGVFLRREYLRVDRWPNLFVHFGLVLVLMGGYLSHVDGVSGYIELAEGQAADFFWGESPTLVIEEGNLRRRLDLGELAGKEGKVVESPGGKRFRIEWAIPHAEPKEDGEGYGYSESEHAAPAIRLKPMAGGDSAWIVGERPLVEVGGVKVQMTRRRPLGFTIALKEAREIRWAASRTPRAYYSWVRVMDPDRGLAREWQVETNAPLAYRGFRFYQSNMGQTRDKSKMTSGFQVTRDPGLIWVTIGISMCGLGLFVLFSLRFVRDPLHARRRAAAASAEASTKADRTDDPGSPDDIEFENTEESRS